MNGYIKVVYNGKENKKKIDIVKFFDILLDNVKQV